LHYIMHWGAKMKPSLMTGCTETKLRLNGKMLRRDVSEVMLMEIGMRL